MFSKIADRRQGTYVLVFILVVFVLGTMLVVRARHGLGWFMDEPYALDAPLRYIGGDHLIVDSWETHFSSAMLLTPFVWVIHRLSPANEGIVLNFRYVFVLLQVVYTVIVWRLLRRIVNERWAIAIAAIVMIYLPFFYLFAYYNNIAIAAFAVSSLLLLRMFAGGSVADRTQVSTGLLIGSGIASAIGVIAYPTMIVALPLFAAAIALEIRAAGGNYGQARRPIAAYALSATGALVLFGLITLASSGWTHLAQALPQFLLPADRDSSLAAIVLAYQKTWGVMVTSAVAAVVFLGYTLVRGRGKASAVTAVAVTTTAAVLTAAVLYRAKVSWLHYFDMPEACAMGIGVALLLLPMLKKRPAITGAVLRILALPTLGLALGTTLGSHEGFETATMPAIILAIGTFIALAAALAEKSDADSAGVGATAPSRSRGTSWGSRASLLAAGSVALAFAFLLYGATQYVADDAPVRQLDTMIRSGPYKGISTTAANVEQYQRYQRALDPLSHEPGRIAFVEEFSLGYLMTGRLPGTYSVGTTYARGTRWQTYIDITGNYPTTIVATRVYGYGSRSDADKIADAPVPPPFGLRDFAEKYRQTYKDSDFAVYERIAGN